MKYFLDEYISTLSSKRQERVYDLLAASKADKSDLDSIAAKLKNQTAIAPIVVAQETFSGPIDSSKFNGVYVDVLNRLTSLYDLSNDVSLLLDTHTSVLSSEIKALEDQTEAMSKAIENYAFTLSDNGAYDFSFIEPFNDETMRLDDATFSPTDRDGTLFGLQERAFVNSASGTLTLSPELDVTHALNGRILNSNCGAYITSDTGLAAALNSMVGNGWRVAISAPRPVSSSLIPGSSRQGAQFELELMLNTATPSDSLIISPFSNRPFEILRMEIVLQSDESGHSKKITLVDGVKLVDKPTNFNFALSVVNSVRMVISQPVYTRGQTPPAAPEERHRILYSAVIHSEDDHMGDAPQMSGIYRRNRKALIRTVTSTLNKKLRDKDLRIFKAQMPLIDFDPRKGPYSVIDFINNEKLNYGTDGIWSAHSQVNLMFRRMIHEKLFSSSPELIGGNYVMSAVPFYRSGSDEMRRLAESNNTSSSQDAEARVSTQTASGGYANTVSYLAYEYDLGIRNVQIGRGYRVFRGVYVSKPLPAKSDSGEVKLKAEDTNYLSPFSDRDSMQVTSVEYSVTNVSEPRHEIDWIPIMPFDESNEVVAERVFMEEGGAARLRFPALRSGIISVYRNGYLLDSSVVSLMSSEDRLLLTGFRLPATSISPSDVYTVDYSASYDVSIVNFEKWGADSTTLASAFDQNGAGQTFDGTYNGRTVTLNYEPFINNVSVETFGAYSSTLGFTGTYQPVTIIMADGTPALNQTNYKGTAQNDLSKFAANQTAYLQSGRNIIFNRPISERFTVYYQYLPSNLKVRVVLRVNDINYVSPEVNSFQIKTKTKKPNPQRAL